MSIKDALACVGITPDRPGGDFVNFPPVSQKQFDREIAEFAIRYIDPCVKEMVMKMKSTSTLPREFAAKTASKPDSIKKAVKADAKSDKAIAKRFGVKVKK